MALSEADLMRILLQARTRVSAAVWATVRNAQTAEDIFQNVVVKALTREVEFDHEAQVLSWAFITARREALDHLRRRDSNAVALDAAVLEQIEQEWREEPHAESGSVDALRQCLDSVPEPNRKLLYLRYFEDRSCGEVAQALGLGMDAVYQRLSRLHRQLKDCVERRLAGDGL